MLKTKWKRLGLITGLSLSLVAAGCGQGDEGGSGEAAASSNVSEELEYTITGIEPGAGQTQTNEKAIETYDSLKGWEQETASSAAMLTALGNAIKNEEPIVVAAWSPHYKFAKWDLKYLEDPKGVFGEAEQITTIARKGLKEDMPKAYKIIDNIHWELSTMEEALLEAQKMNFQFEKVAKKWVDNNQDIVDKWTKGVEPVDGKEIELATTSWDTELFSANVAKIVLEQQGYDVTLTPVDPAILFQAISSGEADASLSPWMPKTHGAYYKEYEGKFVDLGPNVEGARIGLAVPAYMEIDSIEDLQPKE